MQSALLLLEVKDSCLRSLELLLKHILVLVEAYELLVMMLPEVDLFLSLLEEDAQALKSGTNVLLLVRAKVPWVRVVHAGDLCPQLVALYLQLVLFPVGQQSSSSSGISMSILFIPEWDIIGVHQISTEIFIFYSMIIRSVIVLLRLIRSVHF
jgi:hypothetical protein